MNNYKKIFISDTSNNNIDKIYKKLLTNKWYFIILNIDNVIFALTKEKSIFKIENEDDFIKSFNNDIYYKTIIKNKNVLINKNDLKLYYKYIDKYKNKMLKNICCDKYIFGSIAVKTNQGFITTIRGKEDLKDYTIVLSINHNNHTINVLNKKATLNAPLLDYLFKNKNVKAIVHINHEYDDNLPYYDYAFPGTVNDSIRNNSKSFNIKHHDVIFLFNYNGKLI